ncbi:aquaporin-like protein [Dendryphion nanum]|uniref:Aquaporin-like protein n=1 Tax=Dendryphion nanum TaxID=256645 RepID=A0A9P9D4W1_9PLEO|nr:aquaporin-like protein [Dendryphion nanum]
MAGQAPNSGALPQFYGERMQGDSVVERPSHSGSRDALLRLPIQQPTDAHVHQPNPGEVSPMSVGVQTAGLATIAHSGNGGPSNGGRARGNSVRYIDYPVDPRDRDYDPEPSSRRSRSRSRYEQSDYRGPYVEEYYPEDDRPRVYRRPQRAYSRPPQAYRNQEGRDPWARGQPPPRSSFDDQRPSGDYEPDTPTKPRIDYYDVSDDNETRRGGTYPYPGAGGRGPPRRPPSTDEVLRLPWTMWMNSQAKNHFVAFIGEFVGTMMFLFFAFSGTQVANIDSNAQGDSNTTTGADTGFSPQVLQYIALVFAFSLMVNVWIFFRISGGLFNPAVTFAMLLTRSITPVKFTLLLIAQLAGSIFASFLVKVMFPTPLNVRTTLSADTSLARGVFIEAILTAELVFTIFMLAKEKHKATFIAPVGIGLALFIAELVGVYYTGGSLNPARSFGPCVVTGVFDREHWIYWVGPGIGAILAVAFYRFIKILEYEMANPGQDDDDKDKEMKEKV